MAKKYTFKDLIVFEDDALIAVNKPAGIASLADKAGENLQALSQAYISSLQLCHRLDKMTSGVLLLAKSPEVYRSVALQFQHRKIQKFYHTLISGVRQFERQPVDLPLLISTNKRVVVSMQEGKKALTYVTSIDYFKSYTLLECEPVTGRMHQIRVHLAAIRCPIIGDSLYGGEDIYLSRIKRKYKESGRKEERPINHGFLLHAQRIRLSHPLTEAELEIEAPLPKNFQVVLKQLDKFNR